MEATPWTECRRFERRSRKLEVTLLGKSGGFEYQEPAHTTDISRSGMGILTDNAVDLGRPIHPGQVVCVLGSREQNLGYCRVIWTSPAHDHSRTRAGLQFLD